MYHYVFFILLLFILAKIFYYFHHFLLAMNHLISAYRFNLQLFSRFILATSKPIVYTSASFCCQRRSTWRIRWIYSPNQHSIEAIEAFEYFLAREGGREHCRSWLSKSFSEISLFSSIRFFKSVFCIFVSKRLMLSQKNDILFSVFFFWKLLLFVLQKNFLPFKDSNEMDELFMGKLFTLRSPREVWKLSNAQAFEFFSVFQRISIIQTLSTKDSFDDVKRGLIEVP